MKTCQHIDGGSDVDGETELIEVQSEVDPMLYHLVAICDQCVGGDTGEIEVS